MKISKVKDTFDDYKLEQVSFRQLQALHNACKTSTGADVDELRANLEWSLEKLPKPGEEEQEDNSKAEKPSTPEKSAPPAETPAELDVTPTKRPGPGVDLSQDLGVDLDNLPDPGVVPSTEDDDSEREDDAERFVRAADLIRGSDTGE